MERTVGLVAASKAGVVWPGSDGQTVHTVCLVLLPLGVTGRPLLYKSL